MFLLVVVVMIFGNSRSFYSHSKSVYLQENNNKSSNITRGELLNTCKTCHPKQHENELAGPHLHSYKSLIEHIEYINDKNYHVPEYARLMNRTWEKSCAGCHAPVNLFEGVYAGMEYMSMNELSRIPTADFFKHPDLRSENHERNTGIDCLSCHYNGKDIIASETFVEKEDNKKIPGYCFPKPSAFLSSDLLCASCHIDNYNNFSQFAQITSLKCNGCHFVKNDNTYTHYALWKSADEELKESPYFESLVSNLNITGDSKNIYVEFSNKSIPHLFNICRETIVELDFLNEQRNIVDSKRIILNRREDHLKLVKSLGQTIPFTGENGKSFEYNNSEISLKTANPENNNIEIVNVRVITKAQYWHSDSTGVVTYNKQLRVNRTNG